MPLVALPRGPSLSIYDAVWLFPTMVHLTMVLSKNHALGAMGDSISDWTPASKNHLWGFIVQFLNVWTWGGDAFNVAGMAARVELGWTRFVRMGLQLAGAVLFAHAVGAAMGEGFVEKHITSNLPHVKVCGISDGGKSTCEMNYCDILDGLAGTCETKKAGCCIKPIYVVLDEMRHVFWFPFTMRMLAPWLGYGFGLLQPLAASVFQLMVRLPPSTMTGSWINPAPHFLRSYLIGDYSYLHLIYLGTIGAQLAALIMARLCWYVINLLAGPKDKKKAPGKANKGGAYKKGKKD